VQSWFLPLCVGDVQSDAAGNSTLTRRTHTPAVTHFYAVSICVQLAGLVSRSVKTGELHAPFCTVSVSNCSGPCE
jgi:hypothetical protein